MVSVADYEPCRLPISLWISSTPGISTWEMIVVAWLWDTGIVWVREKLNDRLAECQFTSGLAVLVAEIRRDLGQPSRQHRGIEYSARGIRH